MEGACKVMLKIINAVLLGYNHEVMHFMSKIVTQRFFSISKDLDVEVIFKPYAFGWDTYSDSFKYSFSVGWKLVADGVCFGDWEVFSDMNNITPPLRAVDALFERLVVNYQASSLDRFVIGKCL